MVSYFDKNTSKTWVGLSSDEKPVNSIALGNEQLDNGSLFYEMDTTHIYMYDASGNKWWPQVITETPQGV